MLDESEFKPFTSSDFQVSDSASENIESISRTADKSVITTESADTESSDLIDSFKPLTLEEEEISADFISNDLYGLKEEKTDTEKIQLSEEFKNSEFFLENSLLTNAEEFAETIREGAKLHKAQLLKQIEEQANDTDRIHQKTITENQAAEKKRKELFSDAETKVQQIKDEAYKEGFEAGHIKGMQKRYDESEPLAQQANKILVQLDSLRKVVRFQAEEELVKLALQISKNIVAEEIKLNQDVIKNIVQAALNETEVQGKIYLYLHPDDYEFLLNSKTQLERYLSEEQNLVIRQNTEMKPGSINVESDEEIISRSISEQFRLIEENLNEQIEIRQTHLNEVDIDAHNFNLKTNQGNNATMPEDFNSDTSESINESEIKKQVEQGTDQEGTVEKVKTDLAVKKEDSVIENEVLKSVEGSDNISLKVTEKTTDSIDIKHTERNNLPIESTSSEQNNESNVPTISGENTEIEESKDVPSDSSNE